jgi:DNA primase
MWMEGSGMKLTEGARTLLEETAARYEQNLSEVASYLAGRGITEEAARTFRLGYVKGDHPGDSD